MPDNYNIVKKLLKLSRFQVDEDGILVVVDRLKERFNYSGNEHFEITPAHFYILTLELMPDKVIYFEAYLHKSIERIVTYLVIEKLISKELSPTIKQIHEICFYAQYLFDNEDMNSFSHAVNCAIKVFIKMDWKEPYGFTDKFPEYLDELT